jgi:hypothetical protein
MPFYEDIKTISGNLVIDGTLESKHIKTDSIEANKFKGATQEQYFYKMDDKNVASFTDVNLLEFDMPKTELSLVKARTIKADWDFSVSTGTSALVSGTVQFKIQVKVPTDTPTFRGVDVAYYDSTPASGWERVYLQGNYLNYFGIGQVGGISSYREYQNLTLKTNFPLTELVTNGTFTGISGWTAVGGTLSSFFGTSAGISQDSNPDEAYFYQEISVDAGHTYQLQAQMYGNSTASGRVHLSTSSDIADSFFVRDFSSSVSDLKTFLVDIDVDTVYIIGEANTQTSGQYSVYDNFSLKKTEARTYLDISTSGGAVVPTVAGGSADLYHHPFGNAAGGTWKTVRQKNVSLRVPPYSGNFSISAEADLGIEYIRHECRIQARHFLSGDTIYTTQGTVKTKSRMTGQQNI